MAKAFITYAHDDTVFVDKLVSDIEMETEIEISIDKRVLAPGDSLIQLFGEIENSDFLIPVLSENSIDSNWCKKELRIAIVKELEESAFKVVPVVKEGVDWGALREQMPDDLKGALRDTFMARFDNKEYKEAFGDLLRALMPERSPRDIYAQIEDPTGENPFRRVRAEHFKDSRIFAQLFTKPVQDYDKIVSPKPAFIEGGRGTGKTMVLRSLEAPIAMLKKNETRLPCFGVYCKMSRDSFATVTGDVLTHMDRDIAGLLFYNELVLRLAQSLIDEIGKCAREGFIVIDAPEERTFCSAIAQCLRLPPKQTIDFHTLDRAIKEQLDMVIDYIDRKVRKEDAKYAGPSLRKRHLEDCCKVVYQHLQKLKGVTIFFLIDEYENLADFQKVVLNTLIKGHSAETWSFKVAVKKTGFSTSQTLENQELEEGPDYGRVDLDFDVLDPSKPSYKRYVNYITLIIDKILRAEGFKKGINTESILEKRELGHDNLDKDKLLLEVKEMLRKRGKNWEELENEQQQQNWHHYEMAAYYRLLKGKKRRFGGFDDFILLSSGIVRTFLELCGMSYYLARQDGLNVKDGEKISVNNQTEAAYALSEYYLWKISKDIEEWGAIVRGLLIDLGDIFRQKLYKHLSEPEAARVTISDALQLESSMVTIKDKKGEIDISLKQILNVAVEHSVFHEYESRGGRRPKHPYDEPPYDYIINRVFAPVLGCSPRPRWSTEFKSVEIQGLLDSGRREQTKQQLIQKVSKESESLPLFDKLSREERGDGI
jgi:Cdc6-like AAA superfamily ATPase